MGYVYIAMTLTLTVYGQLIVKWRVDKAGAFPAGLGDKIGFLLGILFDPWVLTSVDGVLIAALCWMAALTHLDLCQAYPVMGLSFVFVLIFSAILFAEPLTAAKIVGVAGVAVASQA